MLTLRELQDCAERVVRTFDLPTLRTKHLKLYGIPRGGIAAAALVMAAFRNENVFATMTDDPDAADVFVDDLIDSGATRLRYYEKYRGAHFVALLQKVPAGCDIVEGTYPHGTWLVFPWEVEEAGNDNSAHDIVTRLIQYIGDDPTREGLRETPARVIKAWREWGSGYGQDPKDVLKSFADGSADYNQMVIVHNIPVVSYCEHHLAPIHGVAHVGYIPNGKIVGLSKLARLVDLFSRRLQVQERMTTQIADALVTHVAPLGVGVLVRAAHMCMSSRGVKIHGSLTTTSAVRGVLQTDAAARAEFIGLCRDAK
jgi:GTP cyclohydrolase I